LRQPFAADAGPARAAVAGTDPHCSSATGTRRTVLQSTPSLERRMPTPAEAAAALRFLCTPQAHGVDADEFSWSETHMSWLFFTGEEVLKLKKPVRMRYLDHSTLARREFDSREELRLNARLAPGVYLGLTALVRTPDGYRLVPEEECAEAARDVLDWLVRMRRLPATLALDRCIAGGRVSASGIDALGALLEHFYRAATPVRLSSAAYLGRFASEQRLNREILLDPRWQPRGAAEALRRLDAALAVRPESLAERARYLVDGHGDLRPEHVFMVDPPLAIDCLEFDAHLRWVDPYDEVAFLGLECEVIGAAWIGERIRDHLARGLGAVPPPQVIRLYAAARALMRARLALAHLADEHPREPGRWPTLADRYLLRATTLLHTPD
jgi:aminoglycoside phosphotransferase family enzyme